MRMCAMEKVLRWSLVAGRTLRGPCDVRHRTGRAFP